MTKWKLRALTMRAIDERGVRSVMDDVEPVLRFFGGAPVRPPVPKRLPRRAEEPPDETGTELRAS